MSDACCGTDHQVEKPLQRLRDVREIQLSVVAGVALAAGLIAAVASARDVALVGYAVALVAGGLTFVPQAARGLVRGRLGVDTLMAIAAVGAVILGEWAEAATLAFLFSISEALESFAMTRTRRGLRALLDLVPQRAAVVRDGREVSVALAELELGERLVVRPGERVATDGVISSGRSAMDLSAITGESMPVERGPDDPVFAAAINGGGALEVRVTARSEDNSLARIVRIVEAAQERKGRSQRLAERIAAPLVPGVLVAATLIAVIGGVLDDPTTWIQRSLVVLVAAAPCAFAISVPVTVVAAIGAATRSGVLIKGGRALEGLAGVHTVALDKTGTLTRNQPRVVHVVSANGTSPQRLLSLAAALERRSEHPLAPAILAAATDGPTADEVAAVPGNGLEGRLDGRHLRLGRPGFIPTGPLERDVARLQGEGATVVLIEQDAETLGAIAVRDELRTDAPAAVADLRGAGLRTAMLTGDNQRTATALAAAAGIDDVRADLLPTDKVTAVEELQRGAPVAMVGDGINDAPALAVADVGLAMGAMGTDVAIEAADVAIMGDDLRLLPETFVHARRAGRVMRQNLLLSGGILLSLVPLAATGVLGLAAVVAIHELAEVLVIANGVRAGRRDAFRELPASAPIADLPAPSDLPGPAAPDGASTPVADGCQEPCCAAAGSDPMPSGLELPLAPGPSR